MPLKNHHYKRRGVIRVFNQWAVTGYGLETVSAPCDYDINKGMLGCVWLRDHMQDKTWVNRADFNAALDFARRHFNIKADKGVLW